VVKLINPLVFLPGLSVTLLIVIELPRKAKRIFFYKVPPWLSSSVTSIVIGTLCRGVLGSYVMFVTECITFPSFYLARKLLRWQDRKGPRRKESA